MTASAALIIGVLLVGMVDPSSAVSELSGRYSHHFREGQVDGPDYGVDDVAEVVPIDAGHAYVRLHLRFYNGHVCALSGVAEAQDGQLVYHGEADDTFAEGRSCRLTLKRKGGALVWNDDDTCKAHCGERGSFMGRSLPWSSKRSITYLARLKSSREYRAALTEWRARKPGSSQ